MMNCQVEGCTERARGKSKYCDPHKREARRIWWEKVENSRTEREAKQVEYARVWQEACQAAKVAYDQAQPEPMVVVDQLRNTSWFVHDGPCGFAEIVIRNGNSSFARWLKKNVYGARKRYYGGIEISTYHMFPDNGQSYARKMAAATAGAEVLRAAGIEAYADGRLD